MVDFGCEDSHAGIYECNTALFPEMPLEAYLIYVTYL